MTWLRTKSTFKSPPRFFISLGFQFFVLTCHISARKSRSIRRLRVVLQNEVNFISCLGLIQERLCLSVQKTRNYLFSCTPERTVKQRFYWRTNEVISSLCALLRQRVTFATKQD